jgi:glycosyltransferase involved in cell wall biosynthesis
MPALLKDPVMRIPATKNPASSEKPGFGTTRNLIVVPAYNEEETLARTVAELQALPDDYEILLVNDGSHDATGELARRLAAQSALRLHVLHLPMNCGIGVAVQAGYLFAEQAGNYRYVIQFDADGQHDAAYIPALVAECENKNLDLCVGSRFLKAGAAEFQSTLPRRLGIGFFAWLIGLLSGVRVTDPTSGFRCAGARSWKRFARHYPEDYPEPESLFWCARNHLRIGEAPVRMRPRQGGVSSIRAGTAVYYMLKVSLAILLDWVRTKEHKP